MQRKQLPRQEEGEIMAIARKPLPPKCEHGCDQYVKWNKRKRGWNRYLLGHSQVSEEGRKVRSKTMKQRHAEARAQST